MLEAVNVQLQENEIPLVTLEILAWRMPRAMGELRKPSGIALAMYCGGGIMLIDEQKHPLEPNQAR